MAIGGGDGGGSGAVRAGAAFVELFTNDSKLIRGLESARKRVAAWGAVMQKAGVVLLGAGGAALGVAGAGVKSFLDRAKDLQFLADKLGLPAEKLSAFAYAAEVNGQTLEELAGHFENFAERVKQGAEGSGEAIDSFRKLNIDPSQLIKLDQVDQLLVVADAMQKVGNETQRLGILSTFGGDQFQKLNKLFRGGSEGIRQYMQEAHDVGAVLTPEQSDKAAAANRELNRVWAAGRGILHSLATALLPAVETIHAVGDRAVATRVAVREFIEANRPLVLGVAAAAVAVAAAGVAFVGIGTALAAVATAASGFAAAFGVVAAALGELLTPAGAITAAVAGLGYLFATQTETGQAFTSALGAAFAELQEVAVESWGGIVSALSAGDLRLAGQVAMAGLTLVVREATAELTAVWDDFNRDFLDSFRDAATGVEKVIRQMTADAKDHLADLQARLTPIAALAKDAAGVAAAVNPVPVELFRQGMSQAAFLARAPSGLTFAAAKAGLELGAEVGAGAVELGADPAVQAEREAARKARQTAAAEATAAARAELDRLVAEAKEREPLALSLRGRDKGGAAGPPPAGPKNTDLLLANLSKATGAFLGGANATQVFGQGLSVQQQQLKSQQQLVVGQQEGNSTLKDVASGVQGLAKALSWK